MLGMAGTMVLMLRPDAGRDGTVPGRGVEAIEESSEPAAG
jgi:hypothetical protein